MCGQGRHPPPCYWMRGKEQSANKRNPQADIGVLTPRDGLVGGPSPAAKEKSLTAH